MNNRIRNYIITYSLVIAFVASLVNIRVINRIETNKKLHEEGKIEKKDVKEKMRFVLPFIAMMVFFVGCYFAAVQVAEGETTGKDRFAGIYYMSVVGIILVVMNMTILSESNVRDYIKGKKFSIMGMLMTAGVGAIVFGFLDNFGMKLGTDAMDDSFLQAFLGPFSVDDRFIKYQPNITKNLKIMNQWVASDWRKVMNQVLRFKDDISKMPKFKHLTNAINTFGGVKLDVPKTVLKDSEFTNKYVDNLRSKFDLIDGSKAMMGNTFSDCIGALLGAGIISLFIYMTCYDGTVVSKDTENHFLVKYFSYYMPVMEAVCIGLGCLVPIFLNIAMSNMRGNRNSYWCWVIVFSVMLLVSIIMYFSVNFVQDMTLDDKKYSVKKTLENLSERIDLTDKSNNSDELGFYHKVNDFVNSIDV